MLSTCERPGVDFHVSWSNCCKAFFLLHQELTGRLCRGVSEMTKPCTAQAFMALHGRFTCSCQFICFCSSFMLLCLLVQHFFPSAILYLYSTQTSLLSQLSLVIIFTSSSFYSCFFPQPPDDKRMDDKRIVQISESVVWCLQDLAIFAPFRLGISDFSKRALSHTHTLVRADQHFTYSFKLVRDGNRTHFCSKKK